MPLHLENDTLGEMQKLMRCIEMRHILLPAILVTIEVEVEADIV